MVAVFGTSEFGRSKTVGGKSGAGEVNKWPA
jgi:hypothetical protein